MAAGRYAGKEKTVLSHSSHINYRAWDYKEEKNTLIDERIGVNVKTGILLNAVLLNFALNTKSGCQKISGRGNSSFPAFLAHGVTLLSQWCGEKRTGLGIHGTRICVLLGLYLPLSWSSLNCKRREVRLPWQAGGLCVLDKGKPISVWYVVASQK